MSEITVGTKEGEPAYKLVPKGKRESHTLCYELMFWRDAYTDEKGEEHKATWRSSGKYPTLISHGLRCIAEDIERNGSWKHFAKADAKSLQKMADEFEDILDGFMLLEADCTER